MRIFNFFLASLSFVKKNDLPICINCRHLIQPDTNYAESPDYEFAKCRMFGNVDLVTGETRYEYASICRTTRFFCGVNGTLFEERNLTKNKTLLEKLM